MSERMEVTRTIAATPSEIFAVLTDPSGHVAIDSSGMLQSCEGQRVTAVDDRFVVHMDREALGDMDLGKYDVTVIITEFNQDTQITWTIDGAIQPPIGHTYGYRLAANGDGTTEVTSIYDWSTINDDWRNAGIFPVISESALKATLGILERATRLGYPSAKCQ